MRALRETGTGEEQGRFIVGRAAEAVGHDEEALLGCLISLLALSYDEGAIGTSKICLFYSKIGRNSRDLVIITGRSEH